MRPGQIVLGYQRSAHGENNRLSDRRAARHGELPPCVLKPLH
jgi:hypothetical protein